MVDGQTAEPLNRWTVNHWTFYLREPLATFRWWTVNREPFPLCQKQHEKKIAGAVSVLIAIIHASDVVKDMTGHKWLCLAMLTGDDDIY